MAEETKIGWTDGTVNFVIGCQHAGEGCLNCYAERFAKAKWGIEYKPGGERRVTKSGFIDPLKWEKRHRAHKDAPLWIFACSLSDFFDNAWPEGARPRAWETIRACPSLRWQIVSKRMGNAPHMLPKDWDGGKPYQHVGFIATVVNQIEFDRDIAKLVKLKQLGAKWIGLSVEPMLGRINLGSWARHLDWVIIGGESNQKFAGRTFNAHWAHDLLLECQAVKIIPCFVKQMGNSTFWKGELLKPKQITNMAAFPPELRVQQMPTVYDRVLA